jgi:hypothetical protein
MVALRIGFGVVRAGGWAIPAGRDAVPDGDLFWADEDVFDQQAQYPLMDVQPSKATVQNRPNRTPGVDGWAAGPASTSNSALTGVMPIRRRRSRSALPDGHGSPCPPSSRHRVPVLSCRRASDPARSSQVPALTFTPRGTGHIPRRSRNVTIIRPDRYRTRTAAPGPAPPPASGKQIPSICQATV